MSSLVWILCGLAYLLGFVLESKRLHDSYEDNPQPQLDMMLMVLGLFCVWWIFFFIRVIKDEC